MACICFGGNLESEKVVRMAPANFIDVFLGRVRRIMDKDIGVSGKIEHPLVRVAGCGSIFVLHNFLKVRDMGGNLFIEGFIVADIHERLAFVFKAVPNGEPGMIDVHRSYVSATDRKFLFTNRTKIYFRLQFIQLNGKLDPVHLVGNNPLEIYFFPFGTDNGNLIP